MKPSVRAFLLCLAIFGGGISLDAAEADHTATITKYFGAVQVLSEGTDKPQGAGPHVLFEGKYYTLEPAKVGGKLKPNSIIQTGEKALARLLYPNGDQITVSASTFYKVATQVKAEKEQPVTDLVYGKFRAVISKEGPRNNLEVKTRTMVMGIRGTDFFVSASDADGGSSVSVLRGAVAVAQQRQEDQTPSQAVEVKSGFSAKLPPPAPAAQASGGPAVAQASPVKIDVVTTDKYDLQSIRSSVSFKEGQAPQEEVKPELAKEIRELEKKAIETTKHDIKSGDPKLYGAIEAAEAAGKSIDSLESLQAASIEKALVLAPEPEPAKRSRLEKAGLIDKAPAARPKPSRKELEEQEENVYDKYFGK